MWLATPQAAGVLGCTLSACRDRLDFAQGLRYPAAPPRQANTGDAMAGRWRGTKDLIFDAVETITNLVEETHTGTVRQVAEPFGHIEPSVPDTVMAIHGLTAGVTYTTIRAVNRGVRLLTDLGTEQLETHIPYTPGPAPPRHVEGSRPWALHQVEGAQNGAVGDFVHQQGNRLGVGM
ncbi:MAG: hypothetical protein AAFS10_13815, partial [Myxococcota bacterium]